MEDGGRVTVTNFFAVGDETLPILTLPGNIQVTAADLLQGVNLITTAGPEASRPSSGGTNYNDDPGDLIDGIERLGSLGTDYWTRETGTVVIADETAADLPGVPPAIFIVPGTPDEPGGDSGKRPVYSIKAGAVNVVFDEGALPGGSEAASADAQSNASQIVFSISSNDGLAAITLNGVTYPVLSDGTLDGFPEGGLEGQTGSLSNPHITLLSDGQFRLEFSYSLERAHRHEGEVQGNDVADNVDSFAVSAISENGAASGEIQAHIDIIDDVPQIRFEYSENEVIEGRSVSGEWTFTDADNLDEGDLVVHVGRDIFASLSADYTATDARQGTAISVSDNDANASLLVSTGENDRLAGGSGNDDILKGGWGDDSLSGGAGNDALFGGRGDDLISGGAGDDILYGDEGRSTFAWASEDYTPNGIDIIKDFSFGSDKLRFDNLLSWEATLDVVGVKGLLEGGSIAVSDLGNGTLLLTHEGQAIQIYYENMTAQQVRALTGDNMDDAAQVLVQMLMAAA